MAKKWEYKVVKGPETATWMNSVGSDGWELVSVVVQNNLLCFFFKRPL